MTLVDSVRAAIAELEPLDVRDRAAADLAIMYAKGIDEPFDWGDKQRDPLAELGPKLLQCLVQLGLTPAARKAATTPADQGPKRSPLDDLRKRRAERMAT